MKVPDQQLADIANRLTADFNESREKFPLEDSSINGRELLVAIANENKRIVEAFRELSLYLANK